LDEVRKVIAEWYPIFEEYKFEIDIDLPEKSLVWKVDPIWFKSIYHFLGGNQHYLGMKT